MEFDVTPVWAKVHGMIQGTMMALPNLLAALVVFALFVLVSKWVKQLIHGLSRRRGQHYNFGLAVGRVAGAAIILLGLLVSLSVVLPSFRAADLIQVLGLGSVAIGFAFRDVLQNFLAGILILLAQPFRVGEEIAVDGFEGVVEEIQTRATLIKTWDGFLVVIPNATIYTQQITVFNAYETRRTTADFVVGRDADVDAARALIVAAVRGVEGVLAQPPPDALVTDASGYGVTVRARWWTDAKRGDYLAVRDRVIPAVHRQLIEHGVDLPSPAERRLLFDRLTRADGNHRPARETAQGRKVV